MSDDALAAPESARRTRLRPVAGVTLAVIAAITAVAGVSCLYAREQLLEPRRFADRTVASLDRAPVRRVVAAEIVVQVINHASPDLLAARPLLVSVVEGVLGTRQLRGVARTVAHNAHKLMFDRSGNVVFSVADAGTVVVSALRTLSPSVAAKIPAKVDARLLDLRKRSFAVSTLRLAEKVRVLGIFLPAAALALLAAAVAFAARRRAMLTLGGIALAVASVALYFDLALLRHSAVSALFGAGELTNSDVRAAAGSLWDAYLDDFRAWLLALAAVGALLAMIASGVLRPRVARSIAAGASGWMRPPRSRVQTVATAAVAVIAGVLLILRPTLLVDIVAVAGGIVLLAVGIGELLAQAGVRLGGSAPTLRGAAAASGGAAAALAVLVGGPAIALAAAGPSPSRPPTVTGSALRCNGYAALCERRLDQVVFAGTHNSMSASESPGWLIANQRYDIAHQLDYGIRAFKISTHYGIGTSPTRVQTDITAEDARLNRVSDKLTEQARGALQRFSGALGFGGHAKGKRSVWLCHTLCELGATSMASFLDTVARFLTRNPDQVLIFFDEDYVAEKEIEKEFRGANLFDRLAVLAPAKPLPTLGELIRSRHNIVVFAQEPVSGDFPWDMYGFGEWIQDTPLGAVKPSQFTCAPSRGLRSNPLLMMNDWADVFPPRRSPNLPLLKRAFILNRAQQCERERHQLPNLVLTDFYEAGDLIGAVDELNGVAGEKPSPVVPVR